MIQFCSPSGHVHGLREREENVVRNMRLSADSGADSVSHTLPYQSPGLEGHTHSPFIRAQQR